MLSRREQVVVPEGHGALIVPDGTGDTRTLWKHDDPASIKEVRETFDEMIANGWAAHASATGMINDAVVTREFDPTAKTVTMLRHPVGG